MRPLILLFTACFGLPAVVLAQTEGGGVRQPPAHIVSDDRWSSVTVTDGDLAAQATLFREARQAPASATPHIVAWLQRDANNIFPPLLYELARRLLSTDKATAFEWYLVANLRARYDGARCVDATASQGLQMLHMGFPEITQAVIADRLAYGAAGLRALARPDLFEGKASPWWICSHGIAAVGGALRGERREEAAWLRPATEWPALKARLVNVAREHFVAQSQPQVDAAPMAVNPPAVTEVPQGLYRDYAWYDDRTLMARAPLSTGITPDYRIVAWAADTGTITDMASPVRHWCAANGRIFALQEAVRHDQNSWTLRYLEGAAGQLQSRQVHSTGPAAPVPMVAGSMLQQSIVIDYFRVSHLDCSVVAPSPLAQSHSIHAWTPLLPGHGAIGLALPEANRTVVTHYDTGGGAPLPAPVTLTQLNAEHVRYYGYAGAYFFAPPGRRNAVAQAPNCLDGLWFHPRERRFEKVCLPHDKLNENPVQYRPTKVGMLRFVDQRSTHHGLLPGGIYLTRVDGRHEKIFEGHVQSLQVAPDGCRLAFGERQSMPNSGLLEKVRVINVCGTPQARR